MVGHSTGVGLMRGMVMLDGDGLPSSAVAGEVAKVCMDHGVHVRQASTALFLKPCLVITQTEVDRALAALTRTLEAVVGSRAG
jgi:adenosylmethionine-8-amino-7-oxononanoate aminotransferase